ncbi:MAG: PH domain-containing protein [Chloroflexi bacterium]|nr:PH domain-containing protein [Chloroflexota bacterium]
MFYQPPRALGLLTGVILAAWGMGIALVLMTFAWGRNFDMFTAGAYLGAGMAVAVTGLFAYWTYALSTLWYALDRNGLIIHWGLLSQVVPLNAIERLVPGTSVGVNRVGGISWLGYHVGQAAVDRIGNVLFYSTHQSPEQVLYVMTSERNYAISVEDPAEFAREIQVRQDLGATAETTHHVERELPALQGFWADRTGILLACGAIALGALVWLIVGWQYGTLPETFELYFPPSSASPLVELVGRAAVLELPRTASLLLIVNLTLGVLLYAWERAAAYALFLTGATLQIGFIVAFMLATSGI